MNEMLFERRREMINMRSKGLNLNIVVNDLAVKYHKTARALYKDWSNRKWWIKTLLCLGDPETVFLDILSRHDDIYRMAVKEYFTADNSNARVGALRLLRDLNLDFYEISVTPHLMNRLEDLEQKANKGVFVK